MLNKFKAKNMKTIDEAAKEIYSYNVDEFTWISDKKRDAFITGVEFAQRWIPVEEELPPKGMYVLCKIDYYLPFIGSYSGNNTEFTAVGEIGEHYFITHWRPIKLK